jgi:lipopolysaccharide/colanic/teichoic acid biosynthesis glycosyltransferase
MSKALLLAGVLVVAVSGQAMAQRTISAFGSTFTVSDFAPRQMMVAVATDTRTGRKFNVLKMRNGKMMAIVPMNSLRTMPRVARRDMIREPVRAQATGR